MTITEKDIEKLATLSRMRLEDDEKAQFAKEIDSILGYVEQIKEVSENADVPKTPESKDTRIHSA
jgi:aspartyl-tRNA(Asn)/glutamyl-tRNA(Gln) amidotransferase subunit C